MMNIQDFLMRYSDRPMVWGVDDCSLIIADWWRENHAVDPAFHLRGSYSTEAEKIKIVNKAEGLLNLVSRLADQVGANRVSVPADGCFGVIMVNGIMFAALWSGGFWAVRSETGITYTHLARTVRMWSV